MGESIHYIQRKAQGRVNRVHNFGIYIQVNLVIIILDNDLINMLMFISLANASRVNLAMWYGVFCVSGDTIAAWDLVINVN